MATCSFLNWLDHARAAGTCGRWLGLSMRNTLIAVALLSAASAHADQSVLTYHGALDRAGRYVVPGLTYERARGLRLDAVPRGFSGQGLCATAPLASTGIERERADRRHGGQRSYRARRAERRADLEARAGPAVQRSALPRGNIASFGVTGAPVIDEQRATLYVDAAVMRGRGPRQEIFALSLADGSIESGWPLDVATALGGSFDPSVQNQRGALALFKGKIFVPFSGHWGDCGAYHGFAVGVSIDEPGKVTSFSTRARRRHMGAGRCQRRWTVALRGRQHIRHNGLVRRNRVERRRSRPAPLSRPRATDRKPRLFRPLELA